MTVLKDPGVFHDDGERDRRRNHDRIRAQIARQLRERIGDEELITAGPERRIRVPVKGQREWRFLFDRGRQEGVGQSDQIGEGDAVDLGPQAGGQGEGEGGGEGGGGEVTYEVELDMDEVEQHLFEQLGLPRLAPGAARKPKRRRSSSTTGPARAPCSTRRRPCGPTCGATPPPGAPASATSTGTTPATSRGGSRPGPCPRPWCSW